MRCPHWPTIRRSHFLQGKDLHSRGGVDRGRPSALLLSGASRWFGRKSWMLMTCESSGLLTTSMARHTNWRLLQNHSLMICVFTSMIGMSRSFSMSNCRGAPGKYGTRISYNTAQRSDVADDVLMISVWRFGNRTSNTIEREPAHTRERRIGSRGFVGVLAAAP